MTATLFLENSSARGEYIVAQDEPSLDIGDQNIPQICVS